MYISHIIIYITYIIYKIYMFIYVIDHLIHSREMFVANVSMKHDVCPLMTLRVFFTCLKVKNRYIKKP